MARFISGADSPYKTADLKLTHTFNIKNIGDALLEIKDIDSDCACTAADSDRRIPPAD
jgi:hypothetical protein